MYAEFLQACLLSLLFLVYHEIFQASLPLPYSICSSMAGTSQSRPTDLDEHDLWQSLH